MPRACPIRLRGELRVNAAKVPLNVLVPLGGLGSNEFTEAGYRLPKPLVPIVGRPMILWMFDNLDLIDGDLILIGLRRDVENKFSMARLLRREYPHLTFRVACLDFETRGVTETLYCMLNAMDEGERGRRTISLDADTLWFCDVLGGARALPEGVGASFYFNDVADDATAPYSYVRVEGDRIVDIREKVAISRLANNGAYVFESAHAFLAGLESLLDSACASSSEPPEPPTTAEETQSLDGTVVDDERTRYVSGLIDHMMRKNHVFLAVLANDFASLGSPSRLRAFIARLRRGEVVGARPMRFCFDLDGTLLTAEDNNYEQSHPIDRNIAVARELHDAGHTIIVYTDRGMRGAGGAAAKALADAGRITFAQLEEHGIPYDEVVFGKPHADVYVDHRSVNPLAGDAFESALGWDLLETLTNSDLEAAVAPRHFNSVRRVGDDHVEKTGPRSVMRGEIFWYQHMPPDLHDLFPQALSVKEHPAQELSSVLMARVVGVTFSHLVVNSCVSPGRLRLLLGALTRLHECDVPGPANDVDDDLLCSNYLSKVRQRYQKHRAFFQSFDDPDVDTSLIANTVLGALEEYQRAKRFKRVAYVHGDPVFSNVMLTSDSRIKLLDMRGALGDVLTTAGDLLYDLSKVYQSLCGYDFIILDVDISPQTSSVLSRLRDHVFADWMATTHPDIRLRDIRLLTAAHFFCIVPLHQSRNHQRAFLKAAHSLLQQVARLEEEAASSSS